MRTIGVCFCKSLCKQPMSIGTEGFQYPERPKPLVNGDSLSCGFNQRFLKQGLLEP